MKAAIDEVQAGKMTQYRPAKLYKIPRQTLNDRLTSKVMSGNVGRPIRLSVTEENEACIIFSGSPEIIDHWFFFNFKTPVRKNRTGRSSRADFQCRLD